MEAPHRITGLLLPSNVQNTEILDSTAECISLNCNSPKHWRQWAAEGGYGDMEIWGLCKKKRVYSKVSQLPPYHLPQIALPRFLPWKSILGGTGTAGTCPENHPWKALTESENYKVNNMWLGEMGGYKVAYPEYSYKYKQNRLSGGYYKITETKRSERLFT